MAAKDRIMTLIREKDDLQKEIDDLKRKMTNRKETLGTNLEVTRKDKWVTGIEDEEVLPESNLVRRHLISSDSENGGPGVVSLSVP